AGGVEGGQRGGQVAAGRDRGSDQQADAEPVLQRGRRALPHRGQGGVRGVADHDDPAPGVAGQAAGEVVHVVADQGGGRRRGDEPLHQRIPAGEPVGGGGG